MEFEPCEVDPASVVQGHVALKRVQVLEEDSLAAVKHLKDGAAQGDGDVVPFPAAEGEIWERDRWGELLSQVDANFEATVFQPHGQVVVVFVLGLSHPRDQTVA